MSAGDLKLSTPLASDLDLRLRRKEQDLAEVHHVLDLDDVRLFSDKGYPYLGPAWRLAVKACLQLVGGQPEDSRSLQQEGFAGCLTREGHAATISDMASYEWELSELLHWESSVEQLLRVAEVSPSALDVLKISAITALIKERRELLARNGITPSWPLSLGRTAPEGA